MTQSIAMALHGGAGVLMPGVLTREDEQAIHAALLQALKAGVDVLEKGGSSLDAVQASVVELEECPWFNAGKGAVFTHAGDHELDAAINGFGAARTGGRCRRPVQHGPQPRRLGGAGVDGHLYRTAQRIAR